MLIIINIIILIHSTKKKLQKLFKKFSYGLFKLIYGSINVYRDINKTPDSKVIISDSGSLCSASFSKVSYVQEDNVSLVEIKLKSGYRHQIRAQLSSLGFPIVGDELYGAQACSRVFLHALEYAFEFEGKSYSWCATSNGLFCDFLNLDSLIKMP